MRGRIKGRSILFRYLRSYIGIVLLSCAALALFFLSVYWRDINAQHRQMLYNKAKLAVGDLADQARGFQETAVRLSTQKIYWPQYFSQNKYNELELLEDFVKYRRHFQICREYFLYYAGGDTVFHSDQITIPVAQYLEGIGYDRASIVEAGGDGAAGELTLLANDRNDTLLFVYPMRTIDMERAWLCFLVGRAELASRIQLVAGGLAAPYAVGKDGAELILPDWQRAPADALELQADGYRIVVDASQSIGGLQITTLLSVLLFCVLIALLLGAAAYSAYAQFKPIRRLSLLCANKSGQADNAGGSNELLDIELLIKEHAARIDQVSAELSRQQKLVRQQLLKLILAGNSLGDIHGLAKKAGLRFSGARLGILIIAVERPDEQTALMLEDLSDANQSLHVLIDEENAHYVVFLSANQGQALFDVTDMIQGVLEVQEARYALYEGLECGLIQQIPGSYLYALSKAQMADLDTKAIGAINYFESSRELVEAIVGKASRGDAAGAAEMVETLIAYVDGHSGARLLLRYTASFFLARLMDTARTLNIPLTSGMLIALAAANDACTFRQSAREAVALLGALEPQPDKDSNVAVAYLNGNFSDYRLSVERMSDDLGISAEKIGEMLKKHVGCSYRDYVIRLRIDSAKELLRDRRFSVAEVCARVGYANISHFIKTFKKHAGVTPGAYQALHALEQGARDARPICGK